MKLVILGKGNYKFIPDPNTKVWTVGTSNYEHADKYFEFHGISVPHDNVVRTVPEKLRKSKLPLNCSICIMLAIACEYETFDEIIIKGCPMLERAEYIEQRPSLAYLVGYYQGKGINVIWEDLPKNKHYGVK